jgi:hypothetical protein
MRLLEFGQERLFAHTHPSQTTYVRTVRVALPAARRHAARGNYDLIAVSPPPLDRHHRNTLRKRAEASLYAWTIQPCKGPLVVLDRSDHAPLSLTSLALLEGCETYYKRELPLNRAALLPAASAGEHEILARLEHKIRPFSLGVAPWRLADVPDPLPEKTTDIFFSGTATLPLRHRGLELLESLAGEGVRVDISRERLGRPEYLRRTAQAWLAFSPDGLGWQCFRDMESAACGTVPVMTRPTIELADPFRENEHCLCYDPAGDDLLRVVRSALRDRERLRRMGLAARAHALAYHTDAAIAQGILHRALSAPRI